MNDQHKYKNKWSNPHVREALFGLNLVSFIFKLGLKFPPDQVWMPTTYKMSTSSLLCFSLVVDDGFETKSWAKEYFTFLQRGWSDFGQGECSTLDKYLSKNGLFKFLTDLAKQLF